MNQLITRASIAEITRHRRGQKLDGRSVAMLTVAASRMDSSHVAWCADRYRSYPAL